MHVRTHVLVIASLPARIGLIINWIREDNAYIATLYMVSDWILDATLCCLHPPFDWIFYAGRYSAVVIYIDEPNSIALIDVGITVGITIFMSDAQYYKECNVEAASQKYEY